MKKQVIFGIALALAILSCLPMQGQEKVVPLKYGNMDHWVIRNIKESAIHALNLHSVFQKGTVEFRMFNSTLHAGKVKTYIQFSLAIANQALTQRNARAAPTRTTNDRYTFRTWLLRLGMIGPEFETARFHLLSHLEGNIAWRDPSQLIREQEEQTQHAPAQEPVPAPGLSL